MVPRAQKLLLHLLKAGQASDRYAVHAIKGMDDIVSIEHCKKSLQCPLRIARTRRHILAKNTPGILNGTKQGVLIRVIHLSLPA